MKRLFRMIFAIILTTAVFGGASAVMSAPQSEAWAASGETYSIKVSGTCNYSSGQEMIEYINEERAAQGAAPLELDSQLTDAAMQRAAEIAYYCSHTRPDGTLCYTVNSRVMGENLAAGNSTASGTFTQWKNSPGHWANMVKSSYTKIGIGHFKHNGVDFWIQLFGTDSKNYSETRTGTESATITMNVKEGGSPLIINNGTVSTDKPVSLVIGNKFAVNFRIVNAEWDYAKCIIDPDSFNWSSSDTSVAAVSADGVVTAKGVGSAIIKGSAKSGSISDLYFTVHSGKDIALTTVSDVVDVQYTGEAYTPTVTVYDGDVLLKENVHYTISYRNNVSAGTGCIDIIGMNGYGGTYTKTFNIKPINIDGLTTIEMEGWDYSGYSSKFAFLEDSATLYLDGKPLEYYDDYRFTGLTTDGSGNIRYFVIRYYGNYTGTTTVYNLESFSIQSIPAQTYTGQAVCPKVNISGLTEGEDYKVTYGNNVNVGTATVTVEGLGNYCGTLSTSFVIEPVNISTLVAYLSESVYTYDGSAKKPVVTIGNLKEGTDFTVTYKDNVNAGMGVVSIKGKGNCTGAIGMTFTIQPAQMKGIVAYSLLTSYDGKAHGITIDGVPADAVVTYSTSENGTYSSAAPTRTNAGTTKVYYKITKENYKTISGSASVTINPIKLPDASLASLEYTTAVYDGTKHTPSASISGLTEGTDFAVSYSNNVNAGTAVVTFTGKGNYTGTVTKNFTIDPASLPDASHVKLEYDNAGYDGTAKEPKVKIAGLTEGTDFTVSYSNNVNKGIAVVTITGKGNYYGTAVKYFEIKKDIAAATVSGIKNAVYNGSEISQSFKVYDEGMQLTEDVDYTVGYSNNVDVGTASVTISGCGEYAGTLIKNFQIKPVSGKKFSAKLSYTKTVYNGKTRKPSVKVTDTDGTLLKENEDYILDYDSGRKLPGTYEVKINFTGNYSGSITKTFVIVPKAPSSASAKLTGYDDVKFSWSNSTGADGYTLYYKKSGTSSWTRLGRTTKTYYTKKNLSDGVKYSFKVVPYYKDADGDRYSDSGEYKTASVTTLKKVSVSSVSKSSGKVKVKWKDISGESGYQISKSTKKNGTYTVYKSIKSGTTSKLVSATKGKTYWYKVRAYKTVDGKKIYGPWSDAKKYKR